MIRLHLQNMTKHSSNKNNTVSLKKNHKYRWLHRYLAFRLSGLVCNRCFSSLFGWCSCEVHLNKIRHIYSLSSMRKQWNAHFCHWSCRHTPSAFALGNAVFAENKVVFIPPTAAVDKGLASLGDGVVREPPLFPVTCPGVRGNGTQVCGFHIWKNIPQIRICSILSALNATGDHVIASVWAERDVLLLIIFLFSLSRFNIWF